MRKSVRSPQKPSQIRPKLTKMTFIRGYSKPENSPSKKRKMQELQSLSKIPRPAEQVSSSEALHEPSPARGESIKTEKKALRHEPSYRALHTLSQGNTLESTSIQRSLLSVHPSAHGLMPSGSPPIQQAARGRSCELKPSISRSLSMQTADRDHPASDLLYGNDDIPMKRNEQMKKRV